ncbi:MAG TPA: acetyl-CoA C-acyltransferase, partial [Thermodesulfobacteriota bacterium]|nr:acetyl-CoA C-acyltransferase [Thermodesulfobacteriota bacterium]
VELLNRTEVTPKEIDKVFIGNVIPSVRTPNIAREIALGSGIPPSVPAFTVTSACASASQAFTSAVDSILSGDSGVVIAGGVDSAHDSSYLAGKGSKSKLYGQAKGINLIDRAMPLFRIGAGEGAPSFPLLPERYSGQTLGEAAERLARKYNISREDQDSFAVRSHTLASRAQAEGIFEDEIIHTFVPPDFTDIASSDNCVRYDLSAEALSALPPIFDREFGTVTEGNSAPLSDGASLMLLMSEEKARALGYKPVAFVKSYAYSAVDPSDETLMGPAYSTPAALDRAGIGLGDIDLIEIHEAFSSQVIAYLGALDSKGFAKERLGRSQHVGEVDMERLNVSGGSIAIGHTIGATGARIIMTLAYRMSKRKGNFGLVSLASAGGLGVSVVLEKE